MQQTRLGGSSGRKHRHLAGVRSSGRVIRSFKVRDWGLIAPAAASPAGVPLSASGKLSWRWPGRVFTCLTGVDQICSYVE